jgi:hypothetical protein
MHNKSLDVPSFGCINSIFFSVPKPHKKRCTTQIDEFSYNFFHIDFQLFKFRGGVFFAVDWSLFFRNINPTRMVTLSCISTGMYVYTYDFDKSIEFCHDDFHEYRTSTVVHVRKKKI